MDPDTILLEAEDSMLKGLEYLNNELRGMRSGRASTALVDYISVDYYGSATDLKNLAAISIPEPTQVLIKPFDAGAISEIKKALENAELGLNPQVEAKQIRLNVPPLSRDRREQLVAKVKKMGEETKVVLRNTRRDANKQADAISKGEGHLSEDEISTLKDEIQELLKKHEATIDERVKAKGEELMAV